MKELINYDAINSYVSRIPQEFYFALLGELFSIFGPNLYSVHKNGNKVICEFDSGTSGWASAIYATCKKLDMMWLYRKWKSLPWYDSDILDGRIEKMLSEIINKQDTAFKANCYYKLLLEKEDREIDL